MVWQRNDDCAALLLAAGDAIIAAPDGSLLLWNPAAERVFGYSEEEALGRTLDLIVPERFLVRDETERWQEERALRGRVAELEALVRERGDA